MKKLTLLSVIIALTGTFQSYGQASFTAKDSVDINKISALVLVHGDMWWDPALADAHCYFPKDSRKSINFTSALWMSGYDGSGQLHVAAQTYRQDGNDYWPGPLDASDTLTYATSAKWAKIWKVNRTDIAAYLGMTTHTTTNTPAPILSWPAKSNTNASGAAGAPLAITTDMAPFVDVNSNGIYEPLAGDYPDIKGDQALWWVFSDNGPAHGNTHARPLGVEIQAMAYAYSRGTLIDNVVYYDYKVINKSPNTYNNFRLALWDDVDLGYYLDDFIGFDSSHRMGICYNGSGDDGLSGGHPAYAYGTHIPISAVSLITLPGDNATTHTKVPAGSFIYYNNDASAFGNPLVDTEYNNLMRAKYKLGTHITNDFTSPGVPSYGYGAGPQSNYVFTGDPADGTAWSECNAGNAPGDRRFIITSNDFTLAPGAIEHVIMAQIAMDPDTGNACPGHGFTAIKDLADTAWHVFDNPLPALSVGQDASPASAVSIYPNPAHDHIHIDDRTAISGDAHVVIYNSIGQIMKASFTPQNADVDISNFPAGIYHVLYTKGAMQKAVTIMKE